jgi:DNA-binding transcriptional LysR family regulator
VLAAADHAVAETRRAAGAGTAIRLGCTPYIPIARLLTFLASLKTRPLGAELVLTHLPAPEQLERVRAGELDFAIIHEAEDHDDLEHELLFRGEPAVAYVHPEDALAERDVITPDDLRDEALVTFPRAARPAMYDRWLSMIAAAGYVFRTVTETSTAGARDLMLAVVGGEGVLLGSMFGKDLSEVGSMVVWRPLDPPLSIPGTVIAWQANPSRRLAAVSDLVREAAREVRERDVVN